MCDDSRVENDCNHSYNLISCNNILSCLLIHGYSIHNETPHIYWLQDFTRKMYEKLQNTGILWNRNTGSCFTVVYSWGTKTQIGGFTPTLFIIFNGNRKGHVDLMWYSKTLNNACKTHNLKNNVMLRLCTNGNWENSNNIIKKCCKNQCTSVNSTLSALLPLYYQVTTSWIHKYTLLHSTTAKWE